MIRILKAMVRDSMIRMMMNSDFQINFVNSNMMNDNSD